MSVSAREIMTALVSFPTVSRDTNLPLIDWVEDYLNGLGITAHSHVEHVQQAAAIPEAQHISNGCAGDVTAIGRLDDGLIQNRQPVAH